MVDFLLRGRDSLGQCAVSASCSGVAMYASIYILLHSIFYNALSQTKSMARETMDMNVASAVEKMRMTGCEISVRDEHENPQYDLY